nr:EOG090X05SW [Lepidurus arcticus]
MEDTLAIAHCKATNGMLFAIYDGHGGPSCSQVISKRLLTYVCTALAKPYLEPYNQFLQLDQIDPKHFIQDVTSTVELRAELTSLYQESYSDYIRYLATEFNKTSPEDCITQAFIHLDKDISQEALLNLLGNQASYPVEEYKSSHKKMATEKSVALATLSVAMSGAVACVSYVHNNEIMVASVGDCQAVVGYQGEDGNWLPLKVSVEHTTENPGEVERIFQEHPKSERDTVLRMDRLLGQLMPLRALGDYRFKWPRNILEKHVVPIIGRNALPPNYKTPPYLSATPEIRTHKLAPKDKFLIVASDGLWDQLTPLEVVRLVGEHMSGREALGSLHLPQGDVSLAEINNMLTARREGLRKRPLDRNGATHLLRHALSTTETGLDHDRLSELLTMPDDVVRLFRDDISIIVIYFNTDYLIKAVP